MKSTGIFWIREDFRIHNNPALSFATNNHDNVIALYIYNNVEFDNKREAQKWWLFKSLESIKTELSKFKINLEILKGDELDIFSKLKKKDNVYKDTIEKYWDDKPVRFAYMNNCVGCFHRNPVLLKLMSEKHPNKFNWFMEAEQETGYNTRTFKNGMTYKEIKNSMTDGIELAVDEDGNLIED